MRVSVWMDAVVPQVKQIAVRIVIADTRRFR